MKQNKEQLKKYCSKKYFKRVVTLEEALKEVLGWKEIKKALKTMTVCDKVLQTNIRTGEFRIILTFPNDDCAKVEADAYKQLQDIIKKL